VADRPPSPVSSRDNPLLVRLRRLARHPGEYRKQGVLLLEGEHLCEAWLAKGGDAPSHAVVARSAWEAGRHVDLAAAAHATVIVADAALSGVGSLDTAAPIAFVVRWPEPPALLPDAPSVVLDRIQDAGNVGSILRSAAAFGVRQVLALEGTASLWSPKVLRAGMGAHFGLRLLEGLAAEALDALTIPLVGTSSHAVQSLAATAVPWPCAWLFGNEGAGAGASTQVRCALVVGIPQPGGEESLNVAAAAAICLYESARGATDGPDAPRA
jgi:TrmH family RNA methyltransferase